MSRSIPLPAAPDNWSVAICAMSKTGRARNGHLMNYDTIIGINNTHDQWWAPSNVDMIIAMDDLQRDVKLHPDYVDCIVNKGVPVYSTRRFKKWPNVRPYPLKDVAKYFSDLQFPAHKILDNSINYAIAFAMTYGAKKIGLFGVDLTDAYKPVDLECGRVRWRHKGYGKAPDWFDYYDPHVLAYRAPSECGWESLHFLIGLGTGRGIEFDWEDTSTILNTDRQDFYYGYGKQPPM